VLLDGSPVLVTRRDPTRPGIDEHVEGFGKRWSVLDVMIADELKDLVL
jgi:hypothetical protein